MTITINAQGAERKRLVQTISDWLGVPAKYCGAPTFNYEVDYFTIDRNGSLSFDDHADSEVIERLLEHIYDEGFDIDQSHTDDDDEPCAVCISMPKSLFTDSNLDTPGTRTSPTRWMPTSLSGQGCLRIRKRTRSGTSSISAAQSPWSSPVRMSKSAPLFIATSSTPRPGKACYNARINYANRRTHNRSRHSVRFRYNNFKGGFSHEQSTRPVYHHRLQ